MSVFGGSLELESQPRLRSVWNSGTGFHDEDIHEGDRIGYDFNWKLGMTTKCLCPNDGQAMKSIQFAILVVFTDSTATIAKRQVIGAERVIRVFPRLSAPHRTHSSPHSIPASNLTAHLSNFSRLQQMTSPRSSGQLARSVSLADGPGFLYAFVDHGHLWKIGMSDNYDRRRAEWNHLASGAHDVEGVTLRSLSSSETGDAFGEGKFGQCLCAAHLHKVMYILPGLAHRSASRI
ncbi:hypothetical protein EV359DRAFT_64745 [Lentinula novae-zelandiae]|nr:hypothetical protein EV359DRAFT_64745 [Lentinula novae-zelandiae]